MKLFISRLFSMRLSLSFPGVLRRAGDGFFCHPFPHLERVVREEFLLAAGTGKRVLHFGFLDSPITRDRISSGTLLHLRLRGVAASLYGIDIDRELLNVYRDLTGDFENSCMDIADPDADLSSLRGKFDVILFPEVLEHLPNPMGALGRLKEISSQNPGSTVIITVPNAYSLEHFRSSLRGVELVHPDHYYYFSPMTLRKITEDAGFNRTELKLYAHQGKSLHQPGITCHGIVAVCSC